MENITHSSLVYVYQRPGRSFQWIRIRLGKTPKTGKYSHAEQGLKLLAAESKRVSKTWVKDRVSFYWSIGVFRPGFSGLRPAKPRAAKQPSKEFRGSRVAREILWKNDKTGVELCSTLKRSWPFLHS
jgi:hypothetical protein